MNFKMMRRLLISVVAFMLIFTCAASAATVLVTEDTISYARPDEDAKQYGVLPAGARVEMTASGNGWARLESGGRVGYVRLEDVEIVKQYNGETVYVDGSAVLYKNFDEDSEIMTLKNGQAVSVYAIAGEWAYVKVMGKYGLVRTGDLILTRPGTEASGAGQTSPASITAYVAAEGARAYSSNSTSSRVLCTLSVNDTVTVTAVSGSWAKVEKNGYTGYMRVSDLSTERVEENSAEAGQTSPASITAYVAVEGARAYSSSSTSSRVLCTLSVNDTVTVTAVSGSWAKVEKNGYTGYMRVSDLSTEKIDEIIVETFTAYIKKNGEKAYDNWNGSGSVICEFDVNDTVTVTAYNSTWARVEANGRVMFMYLSSLSREKINTVPDNGSSAMPATGTAQAADWWTSGISSKFSVGTIVTVTDVETGIAWREKRTGGTNHADCQPLTAADTAAMLKAYGGTWSWNRRAVFVTINGVNYAASINGMPHGSGDSIPDNNFNGHHCIHFTNSRTHGTNSVDSQHQAAIRKALNATLD